MRLFYLSESDIPRNGNDILTCNEKNECSQKVRNRCTSEGIVGTVRDVNSKRVCVCTVQSVLFIQYTRVSFIGLFSPGKILS